MANHKETAMEELATMVQRGVQSMDEKLDNRFEGGEKKIGNLEDQGRTMTMQMDALQRGLVRIEDRLDEKVKEQQETLENHGKRVGILEKKVFMTR